MFKHFILLGSLLIFTACSSIVHKKATLLPSNKVYAIASFWNYTETPMAGLRAASIVESVLSEKTIALHSLIDGSDDVTLKEGKKNFLYFKKNKHKL